MISCIYFSLVTTINEVIFNDEQLHLTLPVNAHPFIQHQWLIHAENNSSKLIFDIANFDGNTPAELIFFQSKLFNEMIEEINRRFRFEYNGNFCIESNLCQTIRACFLCLFTTDTNYLSILFFTNDQSSTIISFEFVQNLSGLFSSR